MGIASDWQARHGATRKRGRLLFYVILLAFTLLFMLRAGSLFETFSTLFSAPDTTTVRTGVVPE